MSKRSLWRIVVVVLTLSLTFATFAKNEVGKPSSGGSQIEWQLSISGHQSIDLFVLSESGDTYAKSFNAGRNPSFRLSDLGSNPEDGTYNYELRVNAKLPPGIEKKLADARADNDDVAIKKILKEAGIGPQVVQSGHFSIRAGQFVSMDGIEPDANDAAAPSASSRSVASNGVTTNARPSIPVALDQVIPDDLIVQSSTCTGFDCVDGESFGFDTLRLKENNLRIHFEDTSTSAGYPANDWRIIANDSGSGGANYLAIEDSTAARNPFVVEAGAPASALYVDSTGNIGISNSAPGLDLHMTTSDTPAMRYEQTNAGGFTAQTWDIGANEANFFVRDVTGGSRLSFRIRPGAPTSSIDISSDGDVGVGVASPNAGARLDISDTQQLKARIVLSGQEYFQASNFSTEGVALLLGVNRDANRQLLLADSALLAQNATNRVIRFKPNTGEITTLATDLTTSKVMLLNRQGGFVGIASENPLHPLQVGDAGSTDGNGAHVTTGGVWTNGSSRELKEQIEELDACEAKAAVEALKPVRYNYINEQGEQYVGFIAEDVPELVAQTSSGRKYLSPMDIVATLTKVVQEQQKTIEDLSKKVDRLEHDK